MNLGFQIKHYRHKIKILGHIIVILHPWVKSQGSYVYFWSTLSYCVPLIVKYATFAQHKYCKFENNHADGIKDEETLRHNKSKHIVINSIFLGTSLFFISVA
jgi:hypothetical protein